jgi:hypothetical protein
MNSTAHRPNIEIAAEWLAACCVGGAVAFAIFTIAPGGIVMGSVTGVVMAGLALFVLGLIDRDPPAPAAFELVDFPDGEASDDDVLLLDEPCELAELLLDDPLPQVAESRVVRLFTAAPDMVEATGAIPAPGEMLARIENFLGANRAPTPLPVAPSNAASADASAALHAALADIRRSLRKG